MNIPEVIGIIAVVYLLNIGLVECLNIRPYWTVFVPGLPLLIVLAYLFLLLVAAAIGLVFGVVMALVVIWRCLVVLAEMQRPPQVEETAVQPKLKIV